VTHVVRFGSFEVDLATRELRRNGVRLRVQPQPVTVLAALLERPGDLITREELRSKLWPGNVFIDFDHALNKAVSKLREALGDAGDQPQFIETLAGRGYRFIAPVSAVDEYSRAKPVLARLLFQSRTVSLPAGTHVIGRDEGLIARIDSTTVSRRHAQIVLGARTATIEDLQSKNGTRLNDRRIVSRTELADGDRIRIGSIAITFRTNAAFSTETVGKSSGT
jgi:DNA-binding winged helix-turn-helix (wHTH) protein